MNTEEILQEINRVNEIRYKKGWGTVTLTLLQNHYTVKAYGEKIQEYKEYGLYRTPERAIEEIMRLEMSEY